MQLTKDQIQKIEDIPQIGVAKPKSEPPVAAPGSSVNAATVPITNILAQPSLT